MRAVKRQGLIIDSIEDLILKQNKGKNNVSYNGDPSRRHLLQAYGPKCCYCESEITNFEVDHFWPKSLANHPHRNNNNPSYKDIVDDVRNWHLACSRCNKKKEDYIGNALSPDYFFSIKKNDWSISRDSYVKKQIWYDGPFAKYSKRYSNFFDKLELNGKRPVRNTPIAEANARTYSAILQQRTEYLKETMFLLILLMKEIILHDSFGISVLFSIVSKRFRKTAKFSNMLQRNLGKAYITCIKSMMIIGARVNINKIISEM